MLTLTRRVGETIHIGDDVVITLRNINGKQAKIGVETRDKNMPIHRGEIKKALDASEGKSDD